MSTHNFHSKIPLDVVWRTDIREVSFAGKVESGASQALIPGRSLGTLSVSADTLFSMIRCGLARAERACEHECEREQ